MVTISNERIPHYSTYYGFNNDIGFRKMITSKLSFPKDKSYYFRISDGSKKSPMPYFHTLTLILKDE